MDSRSAEGRSVDGPMSPGDFDRREKRGRRAGEEVELLPWKLCRIRALRRGSTAFLKLHLPQHSWKDLENDSTTDHIAPWLIGSASAIENKSESLRKNET